jgi:hypothetical protein
VLLVSLRLARSGVALTAAAGVAEMAAGGVLTVGDFAALLEAGSLTPFGSALGVGGIGSVGVDAALAEDWPFFLPIVKVRKKGGYWKNS